MFVSTVLFHYSTHEYSNELQSPVIFVTDPKAMHQVVVKDQEICDVAESQLE